MNSISTDPTVRNPLTFEDVAYGAHVRWCVSEKSALKFLKTFQTPREALHCLRENMTSPPDAFWESL